MSTEACSCIGCFAEVSELLLQTSDCYCYFFNCLLSVFMCSICVALLFVSSKFIYTYLQILKAYIHVLQILKAYIHVPAVQNECSFIFSDTNDEDESHAALHSRCTDSNAATVLSTSSGTTIYSVTLHRSASIV
jgi:hypothetical protein